MNPIPAHIRHNFEDTEDHLHRLRGLRFAVDYMAEAAEAQNSSESESLFVLLGEVRGTLYSAMFAHQAEWVGMGGESTSLTEDEIAAARGNK